jgi:hypothetical protein
MPRARNVTALLALPILNPEIQFQIRDRATICEEKKRIAFGLFSIVLPPGPM